MAFESSVLTLRLLMFVLGDKASLLSKYSVLEASSPSPTRGHHFDKVMAARSTLSETTRSILDELSDSAKEKVPRDVYTQLMSGFVPATREVSRAGNELLKAYQAVQKCSDQYVNTLKTLAESASKAFPGAKKYGEDLEALLTEYGEKLNQQRNFIAEFTSIVAKTTGYSNEDKEKVKDMYARYQKQEKDFEKQRRKGSKTVFDQQQFVEESAKEFLRQQEMRYKFFHDKHRNWFAMFPSSTKPENNNVNELDNHENGNARNNRIILPENDFVRKRNNDTPNSMENSTTVGVPSRKSTTRQETMSEVITTEVKPASHSYVNLQEDKRMSQLPPTAAPQAATNSFVVLRENPPAAQAAVRSSFVPTRESPMPAVQPAATNSYIARESPNPIAQSPPQQFAANDWTNNVSEVPRREFAPVLPAIDPADYRPDEPEVKRVVNERRPPVGGRLVLPTSIDASAIGNRASIHNVEEYIQPNYAVNRPVPQVAQVPQVPAKPAGVVPPLFENSDYGRVLMVTQDFNATSGEQITVNRGNKVILIKNGKRGWIFIRDVDTQRTGWIPAPFVSY
ncbi:unnamed protein product [Cylicocyclus nassatus]|uniref:SH3 domain-containing protein n=1 Tax=Cylicocyclus nassatus TaxID=53992 RepID=A0AA36HG10_CYLNA|nr:unnamed protein product [Cylicocyclus nassatus]